MSRMDTSDRPIAADTDDDDLFTPNATLPPTSDDEALELSRSIILSPNNLQDAALVETPVSGKQLTFFL